MNKSALILEPTATAQWHSLVSEAEQRHDVTLAHDLESYLVFLLMRFTSQPQMAASILALDFLEGVEKTGQKRQEALQELGDKCLLFAGLFPGQAEQKHVNISYFVFLGQSAYGTLANNMPQQSAILYTELVKNFVKLMDLMQTIRVDKASELTPLQAYELWTETASQCANKALSKYTQGLVLPWVEHSIH
jgi:hypothetical protein